MPIELENTTEIRARLRITFRDDPDPTSSIDFGHLDMYAYYADFEADHSKEEPVEHDVHGLY